MILHDKEHKTDLKNQTPVLCASCHYSPPLDLARAGPQGKQKELPTSSQVMHQYHGKLRDKQGSLIFPDNASVEETCYQCHPGKKTQCQSCHTGDAVNHLNEAGLVFGNDKFRLKQTYKIGDPTASPLNPGSLPMTTKGPHGLHNVNDQRWVDEEHEDFYERNPEGCKACHGTDLKGTDLAKVAVDRSFRVEGRTVNLPKGKEVSCD